MPLDVDPSDVVVSSGSPDELDPSDVLVCGAVAEPDVGGPSDVAEASAVPDDVASVDGSADDPPQPTNRDAPATKPTTSLIMCG